ncbi:SHOCT domain-containing protein [Halalkalicoccus tibetensis]|uniref:SHOCT domain-containing protein n=1 Tax=Halalkalicoccus tibetensis TaxID=175632 RepID=A0ABD5V3N8_9EURY
MRTERFQRRLDEEYADGWRVARDGGTRVVLRKPDYGSVWIHALIAVTTVWFTFGIGNLLYAVYAYLNSPTKLLTEDDCFDDPDPDADALTVLRQRYARGEISDEEFDHRVERLLGTDPHRNAGGGERQRGSRDRGQGRERATDRY